MLCGIGAIMIFVRNERNQLKYSLFDDLLVLYDNFLLPTRIHYKLQRWSKSTSSPFTQLFQIVKPRANSELDSHPEEPMYQQIGPVAWKQLLNEQGQISDGLSFKKVLFFSHVP